MQSITNRAIGSEYQPRFTQTTRSSTPKRVLVVVRSDTERQRIVEELKSAGYMAFGTGTCRDALLFCRKSAKLHALVTELELPHMWGLELSRAACQCQGRLAVICLCPGEPKAHAKQEMAAKGWQWAAKTSSHELLLQKLEIGLARFGVS